MLVEDETRAKEEGGRRKVDEGGEESGLPYRTNRRAVKSIARYFAPPRAASFRREILLTSFRVLRTPVVPITFLHSLFPRFFQDSLLADTSSFLANDTTIKKCRICENVRASVMESLMKILIFSIYGDDGRGR